jgi:hypothetical protein
MPKTSLLVCSLLLASSWGQARAEVPIRVVEETVTIPKGLDPQKALSSVEDVARIFELYEPMIPWVPGVKLDLDKEVVSAADPIVLELPISGSAIGRPIEERARVTASSQETSCSADGRLDGRKIVLDFDDSTYNVERRIDRIEITACLAQAADGAHQISATGRMYAGYKPEDPALNALNEAIGAKAMQGAFIKQVSAVVAAVESHWKDFEP